MVIVILDKSNNGDNGDNSDNSVDNKGEQKKLDIFFYYLSIYPLYTISPISLFYNSSNTFSIDLTLALINSSFTCIEL